ncbi:unnamed protein product [Durusdinium trenchii]
MPMEGEKDPPSGDAFFAALQAQRSAGELLQLLLEESSSSARSQWERMLLAEEGLQSTSSQLIRLLCDTPPDPQLHEVLLELLWRGLRHVTLDGKHPESSPITTLQTTFGMGPVKRLQALTPQQLLEWGCDIALEEVSRSKHPVVTLCDCKVQIASVQLVPKAVVVSAYSFVILRGHGQTVEIPYCVLRRKSNDASKSLVFECQVAKIQALREAYQFLPECFELPAVADLSLTTSRLAETMALFEVFAHAHQRSDEAKHKASGRQATPSGSTKPTSSESKIAEEDNKVQPTSSVPEEMQPADAPNAKCASETRKPASAPKADQATRARALPAMPKAMVAPKAKSIPKAKAKAKAKAQSRAQCAANPRAKAKAKCQPKAKAQAKAKSTPRAKMEAKAKSVPRGKSAPRTKGTPKAKSPKSKKATDAKSREHASKAKALQKPSLKAMAKHRASGSKAKAAKRAQPRRPVPPSKASASQRKRSYCEVNAHRKNSKSQDCTKRSRR